MHARRMVRVAISVLLSVAACRAQQPAQPGKDFSFTPADVDLLQRSNQLDRQLQEKGLVYDDPATTRYLTKVGNSMLLPGADLLNVHWQFFVLRDCVLILTLGAHRTNPESVRSLLSFTRETTQAAHFAPPVASTLARR